MKIILAGGTGFLGQILTSSFLSENHKVVVLGRRKTFSTSARYIPWDGETQGSWIKEIHNADVVINLAGQSVKCLYTDSKIEELKNSRVLPAKAISQAIQQADQPPSLWIQLSSLTIYSHSLHSPHDEENHQIGNEPYPVWQKISKLVQDWEQAQHQFPTNQTRKVTVRCGVVMDVHPSSAYPVFLKISLLGLGGSIGNGQQMISWIHKTDFIQAIHFLIKNKNIQGPVNVCSPHPISQKEFMKILRQTAGVPVGLPATKWMLQLSSYLTNIDSELSLKSRYVLPKILLDHQFSFQYPHWKSASQDLFSQVQKIKFKISDHLELNL